MEAIAVRNLSQVELSNKLTVKSASARIPSTKSRDATIHARLDSTSAMATATTRTTTAPASTIKATVAVPTSRKLTARSANARIRITNPTRIALEHAVSKITRVMATATTTTTTVAAVTMEATVAVPKSKKLTARNASARIPITRKKTRIAKINARLKITSAMATATTATTTATARTMEAIAVLNLSQVELSRKITARIASARIPKTSKNKDIRFMCT